MRKKIRIGNEQLLSALILQFFFYQIVKLGGDSVTTWYFPILLKIKYFFNSIFGIFSFSVGDILYLLLGSFLIYCLVKAIIYWVKKEKESAKKYTIKILGWVNILYAIFMFSFGLIYNQNNFPKYEDRKEVLSLKEYKATAGYLLNQCRELRENVSVNKTGEFVVDQEKMIKYLYSEQSKFYAVPEQRYNVKNSLFSPIMRKLGVAGYYNPFTGEAQVIKGITATTLPFTIAHEMGHQVGVAPENEANFYSFYMGEYSFNTDYQYSVKYKGLFYLLTEIYAKDPDFVKRILANFSEGMKKDYQKDQEYYKENNGLGSSMFSFVNDVYLKSNDQEGVIAYNLVAKMIVSYYKSSKPDIFKESEILK